MRFGWRAMAIALVGAAAVGSAGAVGVQGVSPQGEVAQVRQVTVRFDGPVVPLGDLRQPDPFGVQCTGPAPAGSGRWASDRVWLYDFREPLAPGVRCTLRRQPSWKPALEAAGALAGRSEFAFSTGGPSVLRIDPYNGAEIEEDQHFLVEWNGAVLESTLAAHAGCEVEGIGERLPQRIVGGATREALLKARQIEPARAARMLVAHCARPLPNDTAVRLVFGPGIAAAADATVVGRAEQRYGFRVRKAFVADFACERERANAPCLPIRPMTLRFSAPVDRALAEQVRLKPAAGEALKPVFDKDDRAPQVSEIAFPKTLPENAKFTIELPPGLKDDAGRPLANAGLFPLPVATGDAPPIAKFAAAPFGVIERLGDTGAEEGVLPVTLRHVQGDLRPAAAGGQVRVKRVLTDADIAAWYARLNRFHETQMSARDAGLPEREWTTVVTENDARGRPVRRRVERIVGTRELSLLRSEADAKRFDLPQLVGGDPRPFEVVGIPLREPGYHVVEIESARLGRSLLDKAAPMYVRTGVLVTNLGVHFKLGRENALVWVTTLDRGRPVAGADVVVNGCDGQRVWGGRTDAQGVARVPLALDANCPDSEGLLVTARHADARGVTDLAFVYSGWQKGIEPWRFNQPTASGREPDLRAHTVFDRTLLRAGETVSMKHFVRAETSAGLSVLPPAGLPTRVRIVHAGSGQKVELPLDWAGSRSALSSWPIPPAAKLGLYELTLLRGEGGTERGWPAGNFRVEEFRLPLVDARLAAPKALQVSPAELPLDVQLSYLAGGGVAQSAARVSALLRPRALTFDGYDGWSFEPPRDPKAAGADAEGGGEPAPADKLVADKLPLVTDAQGAARITLKDLPKTTRASELQAELSFNDPNGEVQTTSTRVELWPAAVVPGIRAASWASSRGKVRFDALALDTAGRPVKGQSLEVRARLTRYLSTRKRMVGGFYAYDNRSEQQELGSVCSGRSDERGQLACDATLEAAGNVELIVRAKDGDGRAAEAAASVWVTRQGELWFGQDNDDRIDVLPEKKRYEPGETARLQVRMPFREATALVAVEREGVIDTRVVTLRGDDPTLDVKIERAWAPNVYVSVLALRGRIREVPWYSFFTWGWKEPLAWARSYWYEGREYQAPTAMVDLSKPAFKLGVAALTVGRAEHELQVTVTADRPQYTIRQKALARIKVTQDGKPLANTEVAFAAVDEALLALRPNDSWDLLGAMLQPRGWGVQTSTAQSEIIGRRHYGRKALPAGGGGGRGGTRELFDTLLVWKPRVALDAQGEATVEVPLNDSLTSFRLVAVADAGVQKFGSGGTSVRVTQDLQVLSGLPPLVRDGDRFTAMLTLRNTTAREMKLRATLAGTVNSAAAGSADIVRTPLALPPQELTLAAGAAAGLSWPVEVPADAFSIAWDAAAEETAGSARASDRIKLTQLVSAAVPVRVLQATIAQLDGPFSLPVAAPADALPAAGVKRGGLNVSVQPALTGALPGLRRYFETYPFACLEQKVSKSVGLHDAALWAAVANALPGYLDSDGLANYFPPRAGDPPQGSDRLTAYLLAATHEAGFALPPAARDAMLDGLTAFVEGRIERRFWSPRADLDVRKLAAIEALSRHGRAQARQLGSVNLTPNLWPTAAVIDWLNILRRVPGVPEAARRSEEAQQILRSRLTWGGTTLRFSNEQDDFWWWLMDSADANAARLILAVLDDPAWKDELPRLVVGHLGRQRQGAWLTTTANLWGSLALDKFAAKFESAKPAGRTVAGAGGPPQSIDWAASPGGGTLRFAWPERPATLNVAQEGSGRPWLTVQALAAVPLREPIRAGYAIERSVSAVERKAPDRWSRGDVVRVRLTIDAQSDMTWVVVSDPVPGGATLLGSGLGRDSAIATRGEKASGTAWPAFEERSFEAFRSYFGYLPRGQHVVEYTLRLNNAGHFALPPTRVEAMYAPESFGELPNAAVEVSP